MINISLPLSLSLSISLSYTLWNLKQLDYRNLIKFNANELNTNKQAHKQTKHAIYAYVIHVLFHCHICP